MHEGEVAIDASLVRGLLTAQFPQWRDLPVEAVDSTGTVNAIYRLGDELCARLPRVERWARGLQTELAWLPVLALHLPLAVPEPIAVGEPAFGYPFRWAVYRWLPGETYTRGAVHDECVAALELAGFVTALRGIDASAAPRSGRKPLGELDAITRAAIGSAEQEVDAAAVLAAWDASRHGTPWDGRDPVWRHCDLLPPNVLVAGGRLGAVIDWGGAGVGDPAADVIAAWSMFGAAGRAEFRDALGVDDDTWIRARGYALHQALLIIPYYPATNPPFVAMAHRTVAEVLADAAG
jgi:aminoglycoside phosphotransferase (APT) family kinase protein